MCGVLCFADLGVKIMKKIMPMFKDDRDKIIVIAMIVASMFFIFIPALLVVLLLKEKISENSYQIAKMFLNFELLLFLVSLIFIVPAIGWLLGAILGPLMMIFNAIICMLAFCSTTKGSEVKVPVPYEFI